MPGHNGRSPAIAHVISRDFSAVVVCVAAGSRYEAEEDNGIAHFLEHAVFLGAGQRDYRAIRETIDRLGGEVSAETSEEMVLYWASANEARDFGESLELIADLVTAPRFEPDSLSREIGTVIQEISGAGDDVFQTVVEAAKRLLWPDSSLGRPVGGSRSVLRGVDAARCRRYWESTHGGDRTLILVVGTATESKQARRRFGAVPLSGPVAPAPASPSSPSLDTRFSAVPMWGDFVRLCFALPGLSWSDPRLPALDLLNGVFGRDETSHLWERIRGEGLSYSTESFVDCFVDQGWLGVLTDAPVDRSGEVVRIVREEIASLSRSLTADELERARESHIARIRNDEVAAPLEWAKYQAIHGFFLGRIPTVDAVVKDLERVTFEDARAVAEALLRPEMLVLAAGGPEASLADCRAAFDA